MISKDQIMPLLAKARPSYQWAAESHDLLYIELGSFARHLLKLQMQGSTEELSAVASAIELLHVDGDANAKEAIVIGLLEGIQNVSANEGLDAELFARYLMPVSAKSWQSLKDFWEGKSKFV